jgi:UDP:flavonoid glycosyltransferase YjiC (YdhE family)
MRLLFCPLDSPGFVFSAIAIAKQLEARGHEAVFATGRGAAAVLEREGLRRISLGRTDMASFGVGRWWDAREILLQLKHVEHALALSAADVVVANELTLGPILAARRHRLPLGIIGLATYLLPSRRLDLHGDDEAIERARWRASELNRFMAQAVGLLGGTLESPMEEEELSTLGDLYLLQSVDALEQSAEWLPRRVHLVGACQWQPPGRSNELDAWMEDAATRKRPVIYAQPGRSFKDKGFWSELVGAARRRGVKVVASLGRMDGGAPVANDEWLFTAGHVSQGSVLPHARAVVSSGHTTSVLGALQAGLPSLLLPRGSGTEDISERVRCAGAAKCLSLEGVSVEAMADALDEVMTSASLRGNAVRLGASFRSARGPVAAAELLERLGVQKQPVLRHDEATVPGHGSDAANSP